MSWARAKQTNRWADFQKEAVQPRYSRRLIQRCLDDIDAGEAAWTRDFPGALTLNYEDVVQDLAGAVDQVLGELGETRDGEVRPALARQADAVNEEWVERFRAGR